MIGMIACNDVMEVSDWVFAATAADVAIDFLGERFQRINTTGIYSRSGLISSAGKGPSTYQA